MKVFRYIKLFAMLSCMSKLAQRSFVGALYKRVSKN